MLGREAYVMKARIDLGASSGATKLSPFVISRDFNELKKRLELFADDIEDAITTVKSAAHISTEKVSDDVRTEMVQSLAQFMILTTLSPHHCENIETTLSQTFLREVGIAQGSLESLQEKVRLSQDFRREAVMDTLLTLVGLNNFVRAIPLVYNAIPAEQQAAQNFVFRSHQLA